MADVIDVSAGNLDLNRSPSVDDECSPSFGNHEEPNPNPRSSSSSLHPPPPLNSRPDWLLRDRDQERDRERDRDRHRDEDLYRRSPSHSPSPSPYSLHERRRSPPLRRASPTHIPPSYYNNRSRRDDGGFDRRTGSPREDGRYGYEIGGGRGGFGDEQTSWPFQANGIFSYYSLDWSDEGFGGYGDAPVASQREGLMTYKPFIQMHEDDILPAEAERRYQEYRNEYITTQKRAYFDLHKEEDWLKEKYHPTNLVSAIEKSNKQAKSIAKEFLSDLQNGRLDIGPEKVPTKPAEEIYTNSDESDLGGNGRCTKAKYKDLSSAPRAHSISSEARRIQLDIDRSQSLARKLDSEKGIQGNILVGLDKSEGGPMGPIILIRGPSTVKGLEGIELLDTLLTYLWRVHGIDYYGMKESHEAKDLRHIRGDAKAGSGSDESGSDWVKRLDSHWEERMNRQDPLVVLSVQDKIEAMSDQVLDLLTRKIRDKKYGWKYGCGANGCTKLFHAPEFVHKHLKLKHPELVVELMAKMREEIYNQNYMNDSNTGFGSDGSGSDWVKSLDSRWEGTINCQDPLVVLLLAKDKIEAVSGEVLDPLTRKIRDEKYEWKYGCGAKGCTKLFHAPEFVHKHLKRKHPEIVIELTAKMHKEIYDQNYMSDPNAPGGTPVMQQPAPPERRPLANRLRDECGGPHMDEDRGNKWRAEGSPTCEGDKSEAKNGGAFGGRGPHGGGAPFLHEFIPPSPSPPIKWCYFPGAGHQTNHQRLNVDFVLSQ